MLWDFNVFKYQFLWLVGIDFNEQWLEEDVYCLVNFLLEVGIDYFMYCDFQFCNIMVWGGKFFFIDYQGGCWGVLQYDLVFFLYQAKVNILDEYWEVLFDYYFDIVIQFMKIDWVVFWCYYYGFVLMCSVQVLGVYGLCGLYECKEYFFKSIFFVFDNVQEFFSQGCIVVELLELKKVIEQVVVFGQFEFFDMEWGVQSLFMVCIYSFFYKKGGILFDFFGNGGGFIFDCCFLYNFGCYEFYKQFMGWDELVINFLQYYSKMGEFLNDVF